MLPQGPRTDAVETVTWLPSGTFLCTTPKLHYTQVMELRYRFAASRMINVAAPTEMASSKTPVLVWP